MYVYVKIAQGIGGSDGLVSCMSMPRERGFGWAYIMYIYVKRA